MNAITDETTWRAYLKRNRGLLVFGTLLMLFGLWLDIEWLSLRPPGILYFLNSLPGAVLILTWYLASKYPTRRLVFIGIGILITLFALYGMFAINIALAFYSS